MKAHEKFSIRMYQVLPEWIFPKSFQEYCTRIAERELATTKQELIRMRWEKANLEVNLSKLKQKK